MNDLPAPIPPAAAGPIAGSARARFTGSMPPFRRLMIRGAFLQIVTLGIYRFWLTTDMRRFYWANTEIGGESPEYTGTAIELLIGFLIAIAILVPIFVLIALAGLSLGPAGQLAGVVGYAILGVLGQYAFFRARRYRLTRTVFRGVRLHQSGSAWRYAFRSILWGIVILLTLGLAYPFAQASLERYKLSCTWYGDLQGSFVGRGSSLFWRGLLLWLIVLAPIVASIAYLSAAVDWSALAEALRSGGLKNPRALESNAAFKTAMAGLASGFGWTAFAVLIVYPAFQAIIARWWLNGLRFGDVAVSSDLRMRRFYGAYLRCLGWTLLIGSGGVLAFAVLGFAIWALASPALDKNTVAIIGGAAAIVVYVVVVFSIWIIYQVAVKLRLWRLMVDSVEITGLEALARVRADSTAISSAVGEGLIDALGAGGM